MWIVPSTDARPELFVDQDFKADLQVATALRRAGNVEALPAYRELLAQAIWAEVNDSAHAAFWHAQATHVRMWVDSLCRR